MDVTTNVTHFSCINEMNCHELKKFISKKQLLRHLTALCPAGDFNSCERYVEIFLSFSKRNHCHDKKKKKKKSCSLKAPGCDALYFPAGFFFSSGWHLLQVRKQVPRTVCQGVVETDF